MTTKQQTIQKSVSVTGHGLHTGKDVTITFNPAAENHGIIFKRIDLEGTPEIKLSPAAVFDTSRGTSIKSGNAEVRTIEHVLSAINGLQIDNLLVEINCEETPIMDGSAILYVKALKEAGIVEQEADRNYFAITENITYRDEENGVELIALPADDFRVSVLIDYNSDVLPTQHAELKNIDAYENEIAPCRTFVFLHELEFLIANNLVKGGDVDNAIVFVDKMLDESKAQELRTFFNRADLKVEKQGVLNNVALHFSNEPARHKLLDLIGDLALVGMPLKGHFIATRPGHTSNVAFAKLIANQIKKVQKGAPKIDFNAKPVYDIKQIKEFLPHRPPFLLVDKIMQMDKDSVIGVKNVTMNEPFFVGHFPNEPVMPGVLIIEAMAQTGGLLVLSMVDNPKEYSTYFVKIDGVKFRHKVVPGDTLVFRLTMIEPFRRGIAHMKGEAFVGDNLAVEAELFAQVAKTVL